MILGLDLATKTGWCVIDSSAQKIISSGVQDFSKRRGESNGIMFLRFRKWLLEMLMLNPVRVIVYERAHFRGAGTEILLGLQTQTQAVAAERGIDSAPVTTSQLKKFATGMGNADKLRMMERAEEILGRRPKDDNEADAVHVARWGAAEFSLPELEW